ncbi:uncharacterized protein LOC127839230 [Dreissena polymorpha]|uniref:Sodefrin-like factor n=1 Tax=Dreissena polymorpha TaxID=45954 RepID=A0A9D4F940_DREPO|nr:uncharacterized protein LOC127839230 [Dreissena polymorpha]KAH3794545.1 hypothetical protein DPMN_148082 [Dreissena polymorpha]
MLSVLFGGFLIAAWAVLAQIPAEHQLRCRLCNNALELTDCTTQVVCDNRTEDCYMDKVITETFNVVYRGGCRGRDYCSGFAAPVVGKRDEVIACTRCCYNEDDCNRKFCGIKLITPNISQCFSCGSQSSVQSAVRNPHDCLSLTTCDTDEVCYAKDVYNPGSSPSFIFGCQNKYMCRLLMREVFNHLDQCQGHFGHTPYCQSESAVCDVCCSDTGCNLGDCHSIRERLYSLYKKGLFNLDTLQISMGP